MQSHVLIAVNGSLREQNVNRTYLFQEWGGSRLVPQFPVTGQLSAPSLTFHWVQYRSPSNPFKLPGIDRRG